LKFSFRHSIRWSVFIALITFLLACLFTVSSTAVLEGVSWGIGMLIVILLICTGIFFDVLGLGAAAAKETPFHAMASERVPGARHAIFIVRNADRFSNFCNDMIGDISGVISGAASALVVFKLMASFHDQEVLRTAVSVVFTSLVSALTVGGKAIGKSFALHYATEIVLLIGKFFYLLERRLGIRLLQPKRKPKSHSGKRGNKRAARSNPSA
jgi:CBS domain containing-hemolysin-like protein